MAISQLTEEDVRAAAQQLARSERGRETLRVLYCWLTTGGIGLDFKNQDAVFTLLAGAFGQLPGSVRDEMRQALGIA